MICKKFSLLKACLSRLSAVFPAVNRLPGLPWALSYAKPYLFFYLLYHICLLYHIYLLYPVYLLYPFSPL